MEAFLTHLGSRFLSCTSSVRHFEFQSGHSDILPEDPFAQPRLGFVKDILSSATNLSRLRVDLRHFVLEQQDVLAPRIARELLFVTTSHALSHLTIEDVDILGVDFHKGLTPHKSTLQQSRLAGVTLRCDGNEWLGIFQSLSDAPELEFLHLYWLFRAPADQYSGPGAFISLENYKHSKKSMDEAHDRIILVGRQEVVAGLGELLSQPLAYK